MTIERNLSDFNDAINDLKEVLPNLEQCLNKQCVDILHKVVNEFENHLSSDISHLREEYDRLNEIIDSMGQD